MFWRIPRGCNKNSQKRNLSESLQKRAASLSKTYSGEVGEPGQSAESGQGKEGAAVRTLLSLWIDISYGVITGLAFLIEERSPDRHFRDLSREDRLSEA